jgi:hypothetical protein
MRYVDISTSSSTGLHFFALTCILSAYFLQRRPQIANLIGTFASDIVGALGSLVHGWIALQGDAGADMPTHFSRVAAGFVSGLPNRMSTRAMAKCLISGRKKGADTSTSNAGRNFLGDDPDLDDISDDDDNVDNYVIAPRDGKGKAKEVQPTDLDGGDSSRPVPTGSDFVPPFEPTTNLGSICEDGSSVPKVSHVVADTSLPAQAADRSFNIADGPSIPDVGDAPAVCVEKPFKG